jgi:hypothetical protein
VDIYFGAMMGRGDDGVNADWAVRLPTRSSGILFATLAVPLVSFLLSYSLAPEFINNAKAHLRRVQPPNSSVPWAAGMEDWDFFSRSVLWLTGLSDSYYLFELEGYHPRLVSASVSSPPPESGRWARKPYDFGRAHRTLDLGTEPPVDEIPGLFLSPGKWLVPVIPWTPVDPSSFG